MTLELHQKWHGGTNEHTFRSLCIPIRAMWLRFIGKAPFSCISWNYIMGEDEFCKRLCCRYYDVWKFKHPNPNDFFRIMEKQSGLELDWLQGVLPSIPAHYPDYAVASLSMKKDGTITLEQSRGIMPMPVDVVCYLSRWADGVLHHSATNHAGSKGDERVISEYQVAEDWPWTHPSL